MTPSKKLEQIIKSLTDLSNELIDLHNDYQLERALRQLIDLAEELREDLPGKEVLGQPDQSLEEKLSNTCVVVNKAQCEALLKTVEEYTDWEWLSQKKPTEWSPFVRMYTPEETCVIDLKRSLTYADSGDSNGSRTVIPVEEAIQILKGN